MLDGVGQIRVHGAKRLHRAEWKARAQLEKKWSGFVKAINNPGLKSPIIKK
jgi:hypothetical protein